MNGFGPIPGKQRKVMYLARRTGFHHQTRAGAQALVGKMLMDRGQRQQRGYRDVRGIELAVRDDDDRIPRAHCVLGLRGKRGQPRLDRLLAPRDRIADVQLARAELAVGVALDVADLLHLVEVKHRLCNLQPYRRVHLIYAEQVGLWTDERHQ